MVPQHIAIIMDGNNRWARARNLPGTAGHRAGVEAIRNVLRGCREQGVRILTLFAFSSENWGRPRSEVRYLMALFARYLRNETASLHEDGVRMRFIGKRDRFPERIRELIARAERLTAGNAGGTLVVAADYGGQWDIARAARELAAQVEQGRLASGEIDAAVLRGRLSLADLPDPDLCIRTGGDRRISNFMLWQFAYSELYFTETLWPDFGEADLRCAIEDYRGRERRFGVRCESGA